MIPTPTPMPVVEPGSGDVPMLALPEDFDVQLAMELVQGYRLADSAGTMEMGMTLTLVILIFAGVMSVVRKVRRMRDA